MKKYKSLSISISIFFGFAFLLFIQSCQPTQIKDLSTKELSEIIKNNPKAFADLFNYKPLGDHEPTAIDTSDAQNYIKKLYDTTYLNKSFLNNTFSSSYVFNISKIVGMAILRGSNPATLQMRIYPAVNPKSDSLTFVVAFEDNGKLIKGKNQQYEFIAPCPWNCPPDNKDYFSREMWEVLYRKIGRKFDCSNCIKH